MVSIILNSILTILASSILIWAIVSPNLILIISAISLWVLVCIGWCFIFYHLLSKKRRRIFTDKILKLDRKNPIYSTLFVFFDYINHEENNLEIVKKALEKIYFCPRRVIRHPEKVRKNELFSILIEYYLSLTNDKVKNKFFWDFNINFFTWRYICVTSLIGAIGIVSLVLCYHNIPHPNDVVYTALYFVFGGFLLPLLAKFFGHFIQHL